MEEVAGPFLLCAGQEGGCEAAIHAMCVAENKAVLLVDTSNDINIKPQGSFLQHQNLLSLLSSISHQYL